MTATAFGRSGGRVVAVLGPTNTGKTHLALERMLGHATGMIGFPLRLLARENYERIVRHKGARAVALLTGEEKIIPPHPSYYVCTVESMPLDRRVDFLAVDEIQLCADPDRGHVFTDRLLHARGESETMFLGSETIKPLLRRLVPGAEFITRPRFSQLSYTGPKKLTRLPPRSAVVAFSAAEVYTVAEIIRRQRGGTAVVLGALSPRTRNAQVGMYQAGEVDYLVATDAIGMGLNMDVDHVAFAALRKFDGRHARGLEAAELAQIAGRAGRHMNDGTFGTTDDVGPMGADAVEAIESHTFPPLKRLFWRNTALRFTSVKALLAGLALPPEHAVLHRVREADDQQALEALAHDADILALASHPGRVRLLWEVCQIPDFRKVMADNHTRLLGQIYRHLAGPTERLPNDWLNAQVGRLDRADGDLDTIIGRIANVRTWTYIAHRGDWVVDPAVWQERTRAIEDKLSDALHDRLTQRFVDKRTTVLVKKLKDGGEDLVAAVAASGEVLVEGQFVGRLEGFRFRPDATTSTHEARAVAAAATRALKSEIARRVRQVAAEADAGYTLAADNTVLWRGAAVARLAAGAQALSPQAEPLDSDLLDSAGREAVRRRLGEWLVQHLQTTLAPLFRLRAAPLAGAARGVAFQLAEALGSLPRAPMQAQIQALDESGRTRLASLGVRFGIHSVYLPALLKPAASQLRAQLWAAHHGLAAAPAPPPPGRVSLPADPTWPPGFAEAVGFRCLGDRAVRVDMLERFAAETRALARSGPFAPTPALMSLLGVGLDEAGAVLQALGYAATPTDAGPTFAPARVPRPRGRPRRVESRAESPFAGLKGLMSV